MWITSTQAPVSRSPCDSAPGASAGSVPSFGDLQEVLTLAELLPKSSTYKETGIKLRVLRVTSAYTESLENATSGSSVSSNGLMWLECAPTDLCQKQVLIVENSCGGIHMYRQDADFLGCVSVGKRLAPFSVC